MCSNLYLFDYHDLKASPDVMALYLSDPILYYFYTHLVFSGYSAFYNKGHNFSSWNLIRQTFIRIKTYLGLNDKFKHRTQLIQENLNFSLHVSLFLFTVDQLSSYMMRTITNCSFRMTHI